MILKSEQHDHAIELRKRGFTYDEIAQMVGVSKSTVSTWLSGEKWSQNIKEDNTKRAARENSKRISLLNKARGNQYKKMYAEAERSAETEFKHYKNNSLFIAGLMLYVGDGDVTQNHRLRLTSSNTEAHRIFIKFTCEYLGVSREKVRFWLLLYPAHKPLHVSRSWAKKINVPLSQFHKYQVVKSKNTMKILHDGVGNTIIGGTVLKKKLLKWIELASKEL